jgi:lipoyl(octanoyl) transferase
VIAVDVGRVDYGDALDLQHRLAAERARDEREDVLVVCEHPAVYTAGRNADLGNVLGTSTIPVVRADRGGDITYHGPGQVVIYPIIRLEGSRQVRRYVGVLQDACIAVAAAYGITAHAEPALPGVWVGADKLAAIGVRVRRGSTSHGLAFNVDPDLSDYDGIVACGIRDRGVCSLASLGVRTSTEVVARALVAELAQGLERPVRWTGATALDAVGRAA